MLLTSPVPLFRFVINSFYCHFIINFYLRLYNIAVPIYTGCGVLVPQYFGCMMLVVGLLADLKFILKT